MKQMIAKIPLVAFLITSNIVLSQFRETSGRYYTGDEDIPLPSLDFTGKALIAAVILFTLGMIISKANGNDGSTFGAILVFLGVICAIPGLAWLQTIVASIWILGIGVAIVLVLIVLLWEKLKGK
jgi:Flp pilus assembly protein TadB